MLPRRLAACAKVVAVGSRNGVGRLFVPPFRARLGEGGGVMVTKCCLSASASSGATGRDTIACTANQREAVDRKSLAGGRHITTTAREELMTCPTERAVAANLFFSFGTVDQSGEVTLQPHDLRRMLQSMGVVVSEDKLSQMVSRADKASTGYISEDDFLEAFDWLMLQGQDERDYMAIFNMLDRDNNGYVDVDELTNLHSTTKERLTMLEAKTILQVADKNGDGRMNYEEFLEMMTENTILGWKLLTTFRVIFVMGGPASGKGTICAEVVKRSNSVHVSCGDLLRAEVQQKTPLGLQVAEKMKQGKLVDASTVLALLEKFLTLHPGKHVLLDGFPRSLDNARDWARLFGPPEACIRVNCPNEEMETRIVERGKGSGRADDHVEAAKVRIATYHQQSSGPSKYFESIGLKLIDVDGTRSIKENTDFLLQLPMLKSTCYQHIHDERKGRKNARTVANTVAETPAMPLPSMAASATTSAAATHA
eukprot:jgi/Undpi1/10742/HiC_scaffold_29.g13190.m1